MALGWLVARPIAHRGLHDAGAGVSENSLSAAQAAIAQGFAIECDLQISADGEAMVFHDFGLERLTEAAGPVREKSAAALSAIPLKGGRDTIPTLSSILDRIGGRVPVVIEIKSRFDGDLALMLRVAEIIAERPGQPIAVKSFDPVIVAALRMQAPTVPRGIVAKNDYSHVDYAELTPERKHALANLLHYEESRPDFLSWRASDLPSAAPYLCRSALGLPVMGWTVRTPEQHAHARRHADQIVFEGFLP